MLTKLQLERYADVLLWGLATARKGGIRKKDHILIRYDGAGLPLAEIVYARALSMGFNPIQRVTLSPAMEKSFFELSTPGQLSFHPPGERELYQNLHGGIYILAPSSLTHLAGVDAGRIAKAALAKKSLRDILDDRENQGEFSWTLGLYPTDELARHAGLPIQEYCAQVVKACFLNRKRPVAKWMEIHHEAEKIKTWLNQMDVAYYHMESAGIDLKIVPGKNRRWVGISGHNIPSFELFLSPDARGTEGIYTADQTSYRSGNIVQNVRLVFKKGEVVEAGAETGDLFLKKQIATDRGAKRLGEFSLTDKRFSQIDAFMAETLYDENFGGAHGNSHIALGASYADTYNGDPATLTRDLKKELGFNDSALHWDLVNTKKKKVTAHLADGGECIIYENGMFRH